MNTKIFKRVLLASAAFGGAATSQAAFAQAAAPQNSDDIIVTARRTEERLQDVPISITVVSKDAIEKANITNATDLAISVPSLSSNANFGPEKASFAIRGFTQEGKTSPSVGAYFADVVAPRSNGGTTSGNGAGPGSMFDLENIQVLKGPQGTLFGRNTTGGAILLVPTKPKSTLEGYVEGSIGDFNMRRIQAVVNVPLSDTFRIRAAIDENKRDGYLNNVSGIGPSKFGNTDYFAGRLSIVGELTPDLENYTIFSFSNSHNNGVVPNLLECNPGATAQPAATFGPLACAQIAQQKANGANAWTVNSTDPHPYQRTKQWQVINTTTWTASDSLTVKNIISYAEYRESSSFSLWGTNLQIPAGAFGPGSPAIPLPTIQLDPGPSGYNAAQSTFTEEFQLHGRALDGRLDWQAGAYLELSNPLGYSSGSANIFGSSLSVYSIKDYFNNKGLYAQGDYKITDKLTFTGGIRYTNDKMKDDDINTSVILGPTGQPTSIVCQNILAFPNTVVTSSNSPTCDLVTHQNSSKPTWLLNLDYKLTPDAMVYAKWARGYRQGAINPNNLGFPSWGPEKVDTYEIGAKTSWQGSIPGYFNIAGFYNDFRNQQLSVNPTINPGAANGGVGPIDYTRIVPPQQLILNAGKSRIWGVEIDASVRPTPAWKLDVSYAYLNTKLLSFTTPALPPYYLTLATAAQLGGPLELSPKNKITVTSNYILPLDASIGSVSLGATFTHSDSQRALAPGLSPMYQILPSNLLNLNVDWKGVMGKPVDLAFFMTNVTNEDHILFNDGAYQTIGADGGHPELPRMFGFRMKVHYN